MNNQNLRKKSKIIRKELFEKFLLLGEGHPGSCFSIIEILVILFYKKFIKVSKNKLLDSLIISKGHATSAAYFILSDLGVLKKKEWINWGKKKSILRIFGNHKIPGIEATTGSLGHGVGIGSGISITNKNDGIKNKVFVIISEGELYEGSTWESLLFASHNKLENLCVIIDVNQLIILGKTKDCLNLDSIEKKMKSFNFDVSVCNGHDLRAIEKALTKKKLNKKPKCIICNTIKGKGSSIMENKPNWHYWNKLTEEEISKTRKELS